MQACTTSASECISSCAPPTGIARRRWSSACWAASARCSRLFAQATAMSRRGRASTASARQPRGEAEQADHPAVLDQRHGVPLDQVGGPFDGARGQRVRDRLGDQVVLGEPVRRPPVQPRHPVGVVALETAAQVLGEQVVVAEPLALVVERAQEQVAAFELLEHRLAVHAVGQPAREVAAEPVAHRRGQQELQDLRRLGAQHVLREVLADGVVAPGEAADQLGRGRRSRAARATRAAAPRPSRRCPRTAARRRRRPAAGR